MCEWSNGGDPVKAPDWWHRETICVDRCIIPQIEALWAAGVKTLGCCCGHGKTSPSIVINENSTAEEVATAVRVLEATDTRLWTIEKWCLCRMATANHIET